MTAHQLAAVAQRAILDVQADAQVTIRLLSDGGEGFLNALDTHGPPSLLRVHAPARNAHGQWRPSVDYRLDEASQTAWIETSVASGWDSLPTENATDKHPMSSATWGSGDLALHAIEHGASRIVLGLGGSCSTDGGLGALEALGYRFLDARGRRLIPGANALQQLHEVIASTAVPSSVTWTLACDVQHRFAESAAAFGPPKGASPEQVLALEMGMQHAGGVLTAFGRRPILDLAMTGSAGGLAGGLHALLGASLVPGFDCMAEATQLDTVLAQAHVILTGEGQVDASSTGGKLLPALARRAARFGVPVVAFAGRIEGNSDRLCGALGLAELHALSLPEVPVIQAMAETKARLYQAVQTWYQRRA